MGVWKTTNMLIYLKPQSLSLCSGERLEPSPVSGHECNSHALIVFVSPSCSAYSQVLHSVISSCAPAATRSLQDLAALCAGSGKRL